MSNIIADRYTIIGANTSQHTICRDENLAREVQIHWVADISSREQIRQRLATLQLVRSPYIALIYDLVELNRRVGVVEEALTSDVLLTDENRLLRLYQFCAGLAALHERNLAHGALESACFRTGQGNTTPRLCNLAFGSDHLKNPLADGAPLATRLSKMGAAEVNDEIFQHVCSRLSSRTGDGEVVAALRDRLAALLLVDKHRALIHWRGTSVELGSENRHARLKHPAEFGVVRIVYDGTRFFLGELSGEVLVNNTTAALGQELPSSCVISLGAPTRPTAFRYFVTFDQSHPGVLNATD